MIPGSLLVLSCYDGSIIYLPWSIVIAEYDGCNDDDDDDDDDDDGGR